MTKIMLLGHNGQVGHELIEFLAPLGDLDSQRIDLIDSTCIINAIEEKKPDIVVNAAAYTDVDKAEIDPDNYLINAKAPYTIANTLKRYGGKLLHYSTDYVYDGIGRKPFSETTLPNPINKYGKAKLDGEKFITESGCDAIILRVQRVYSYRRKNFVSKMLELGREEDEVHVNGHSCGTPISAREIARLTAEIIKGGPSVFEEKRGIYNLTCRATNYPSWHDFAVAIFSMAKEVGIKNIQARKISPCKEDDFPRPAARPNNCRLDISKFITTFGIRPREWQECLLECLKEIKRN